VLRISVAKACVDVICVAPVLYMPCFYMYTGMAQGKSFDEAQLNLENKWWTTTTNYLGFWLPLMFTNFLLVPISGQAIFMNSANM
jgi:hypothetical protein